MREKKTKKTIHTVVETKKRERHFTSLSPSSGRARDSTRESGAMPRQGRRGSADHAVGGSTPIAAAAASSRDRSKTRAGASSAALGDDDDDDAGFTDRATRRAEVLAAQYGSPAPRRSQGSYAAGKREETWGFDRRNWGPS